MVWGPILLDQLCFKLVSLLWKTHSCEKHNFNNQLRVLHVSFTLQSSALAMCHLAVLIVTFIWCCYLWSFESCGIYSCQLSFMLTKCNVFWFVTLLEKCGTFWISSNSTGDWNNRASLSICLTDVKQRNIEKKSVKTNITELFVVIYNMIYC